MQLDFDKSRALGPRDQQVLLGSTASLSCVVPIGYPNPQLSWIRENNGQVTLVTERDGYKVRVNIVSSQFLFHKTPVSYCFLTWDLSPI